MRDGVTLLWRLSLAGRTPRISHMLLIYCKKTRKVLRNYTSCVTLIPRHWMCGDIGTVNLINKFNRFHIPYIPVECIPKFMSNVHAFCSLSCSFVLLHCQPYHHQNVREATLNYEKMNKANPLSTIFLTDDEAGGCHFQTTLLNVFSGKKLQASIDSEMDN